MKKYITIILTIALCISFTACNKKTTESSENNENATETVETVETTTNPSVKNSTYIATEWIVNDEKLDSGNSKIVFTDDSASMYSNSDNANMEMEDLNFTEDNNSVTIEMMPAEAVSEGESGNIVYQKVNNTLVYEDEMQKIVYTLQK